MMSEKKEKRRNSFRKLIPSLFSSKVRPKENEPINSHHAPTILKASIENNRRDNQYENPKSAKNNNDSTIYENLSLSSEIEIISDGPISFESSSSTLVSENVSKFINNKKIHNARPQVPPKPINDSLASDNCETGASYPDVYYHSLEELTDNVTPLDEIEIHKATYRQKIPTAVGAEIKKVSTKFLISPKKEAEVRTNRPKRARSLSLDKQKSCQQPKAETDSVNKHVIKKPYIYSAPTSPITKNHKIPSMPGKTSPYDTVRKALNDAETRRHSLRKSVSPPPTGSHVDVTRNSSTTPTSMRGSSMETISSQSRVSQPDISDREKTRQTVEAFYWKKLKELKIKEDELLKNTLDKAIIGGSDEQLRYNVKANQLPDNSDIRCKYNKSYDRRSPFVRGAPERATDSMIRQSVIVYRRRHDLPDVSPSKHSSLIMDIARVKDPKPQRTSFDDTRRSNSLKNKRISAPICTQENSLKIPSTPPTPPLRTTSVNSAILADGRKLLNFEPLQALRGHTAEQQPPANRATTNRNYEEDDWHHDGSRGDGGVSDSEPGRGLTRGRPSRRDDPRRHTLAGNNLYMHHHHPGQFNSHEMEGHHQYKQFRGTYNNVPHYAVVNKNPSNRNNCVPLNSDARLKKPPLPRSCQQNNAMLFDDDPGIMSEVETSSTGFRRGGKQRSSLPVVRTPSKTLERPLGLVFLQYRSETKRALLPNEITSIDTVKALFVRSFPKQLSMQYMDSPLVKIYIHDSSKDMFYELEDLRAHLREIRDRTVLRLFEATDINGGVFPGSVGVGSLTMPPAAVTCSGPSSWDQDQSYFSEPEIDSEYHHQHVHKTKVKAPAYYMGTAAPSTLPRGGGSGAMLRAYSPAAPPVGADRGASLAPLRGYTAGGTERPYSDLYNTIPNALNEGYMSSPERAGSRVPYEDPYYSQYMGVGPGRSNITPIIDEEASDSAIDDAYQMYGGALGPRPMPRAPYDRAAPVEEMQRLRVEKMERQLANLTGLVQKALQVPGAAPAAAARHDCHTYTRPVSQDMTSYGSVDRPPKLGKDKFQKSVSFEKSVSFSDDPPDMNSPKTHSPQHSADTKPTKPAIKSSTLPRTSSQERDRLKPAPPPKPVGLVGQQMSLVPQRTYTINVSADFLTQLDILQNQSRDLMLETRNLRRSTLTHAMQMRQMMADAIIKIGALAAKAYEHNPEMELTREEEIYRHDMLLLENDLYELEATVERLRGQAANRSEETRVNMADIERIAMVLSKSSKTVADWKLKFPMMQAAIINNLGGDVEKYKQSGTLQVVRREKLLEKEPERLEMALRRCKKLTGTLVTLKRLACVQEQRLPLDGRESPSSSQGSTAYSATAASSEDFHSDTHASPHSKGSDGRLNGGGEDVQRPENALDALLDELQTFSSVGGGATVAVAEEAGSAGLRRLHSYPSGSDTDASPPVRARGLHPPKPPIPERHPELVALAGSRRAPPPPPPRTTSRSPLASPTAGTALAALTTATSPPSHSPALSTEPDVQSILEQRHRDLLKKQKALQEQYARLQMIQRTGPILPTTTHPDLKKTGSESNLLSKMNLNMTTAPLSGSMSHLAGAAASEHPARAPLAPAASATTTKQVYETDIL